MKKYDAQRQIKRKYVIEQNVLGSGAFGKVFLATSVTDSNFKVAIKALTKKKIKTELKSILDEIAIIKELDHPNIVKYYETYQNEEFLYIVMEYCPGGDLFELITKKSKGQALKESIVADIMYDLLKAINHCHECNVVH